MIVAPNNAFPGILISIISTKNGQVRYSNVSDTCQLGWQTNASMDGASPGPKAPPLNHFVLGLYCKTIRKLAWSQTLHYRFVRLW